ncbi:MAG TPA: hypothetical protein DDZ51_13535 [Planctomycetaceae bacterium]|nr:hypothetical protein [Planctomycetaceae bacterium]
MQLKTNNLSGIIRSGDSCASAVKSVRRADVPWICQGDNYLYSDRTLGDAICHRIDNGLSYFDSEPASSQNIGDTIAFLHYTSESNSDPVGVAVSHENLLHNLEKIRVSFG